jgi:apolipoprotein N-acyltransferase
MPEPASPASTAENLRAARAPALHEARGILPLPRTLAFAGAALSGLLYWLGFAGMDVWPLSLIAFVPLLVSIHRQTPKQALFLGVVAGATMNLAGFYWLQEMLVTFSGFPAAICFFFVLLVCIYQGGRIGLLGWLYARATARGWPAYPMFAAAFVASELLYPLLFPWYFAAGVHGQPLLTQTAELGGPILVGLVVLLANFIVAEPLLARAERRTPSVRLVGACAAMFVAALGFGFARIASVDARVEQAEEAHVGIVQGNMGLMQKREDPSEGLRRHQRLSVELKERGVDFVVWSESAVTFAVPESMAEGFMRDRVARRIEMPAIFGAVLFRRGPDEERWFNTALATDASGAITGRFDKQYLLAFGEYLPFGESFPILYQWSPNSGRFSPGKTFDPVHLDVRGTRRAIATLICYEDIIPSFVNKLVAHGDPELLVNMTNDAWFGDTIEPWEHLALAKFRAIEHRRYLVRSTNSGVSAVIDPVGRVVVHGGTFRAEALDAKIRWLRGRTIYGVVGDIPWYVVAVMVGVFAWVRRPGRPS